MIGSKLVQSKRAAGKFQVGSSWMRKSSMFAGRALDARFCIFEDLYNFSVDLALAIFHVLPRPKFNLERIVMVEPDGPAAEACQKTLIGNSGVEWILSAAR